QERAQQYPEDRAPQRFQVSQFPDRPAGIVSSQHIQPSGEYKPKPSDRSSQCLFRAVISDPYQKGVGKQGVAEAPDGIGNDHGSVIQPVQPVANEANRSQYIQQQAHQHGPFRPEPFGQNTRKPGGDGNGNPVSGKQGGGLLYAHALLNQIGAEPSLFH